MREVRPDLALGTTPLVQAAKEEGVPAIYFTSMVAARPLFGAAGIGALAGIVANQTRGRDRFARMVGFFDKVGGKETAGYGFAGVPAAKPAKSEEAAKAGDRKPARRVHESPALRAIAEPVRV